MTHLVTCQGRDHLVNIRSGRHNLVLVNVHLEPELSLRQLRGRLRLVHPHWLAYPNGVGIKLFDLNICDPEEERFHVWYQTFTDCDPRKTAVFHSFSTCEGGGDVVGVVTPLVGGVAQAFHDDQVVELRVQLAVQEVEGKEEYRKGQVEVEEEKRLKEVRSWMTMEVFMTRLRS